MPSSPWTLKEKNLSVKEDKKPTLSTLKKCTMLLEKKRGKKCEFFNPLARAKAGKAYLHLRGKGGRFQTQEKRVRMVARHKAEG